MDVRRRKLLSTIAMLSLSVLSPKFAHSRSKVRSLNKNSKKVTVIGSGISGLAAACELQEQGFEVVVLESRNKLGGRLRTDRQLGIAFDEGASWIHGPIGNPITGLSEKSGIETYLTRDDDIEVFDIDGSRYSNQLLERAEGKYNNLVANLDGALNQSFESAFYESFPEARESRLWTYMLSAFMEFDSGGDISKLSSLDFYDDETFGGADLIVTNGFDRLANYLAESLDVRLNMRVNGIDYSGDKVIVRSNQDSVESDYVVVTVPLGVLKRDGINFTPSLPDEHQEAIDKLAMGSVNKFLCVWDKAFWDENLQYIGFTPKSRGKFNYFLNAGKFVNAKALMTFAFGEYSIETERMTDTEVIEAIMTHLRAVYGDDIPSPSAMLRTRWSSDPHTFGAYSYVPTGARSFLYEGFEKPVLEKVFFAGEHTSLPYRGTVHGAYLSGLRAANQIMDML